MTTERRADEAAFWDAGRTAAAELDRLMAVAETLLSHVPAGAQKKRAQRLVIAVRQAFDRYLASMESV